MVKVQTGQPFNELIKDLGLEQERQPSYRKEDGTKVYEYVEQLNKELCANDTYFYVETEAKDEVEIIKLKSFLTHELFIVGQKLPVDLRNRLDLFLKNRIEEEKDKPSYSQPSDSDLEYFKAPVIMLEALLSIKNDNAFVSWFNDCIEMICW